jgi:uncharacterized protein YutE (UPF0331/DUF86 family)
MRLDLYQAETARIATEQAALLMQAREIMAQSSTLSLLEQSGVLHALQILIENAIGKAKQLLKARNETVPISAYDAFSALARCGEIEESTLPAWNEVIGFRNRIVHDYMNIDKGKVIEWVMSDSEKFIMDFLLKTIEDNGKDKH